MSQCVSCNNQPNDNDSLGGGEHEGAVTPMVVGIIAGTVAVFVLVLVALFYCAKLENDKARRSLKAEVDDNLAAETDGGGDVRPLQQQGPTAPPPPPPLDDDEGVEMLDGDDDGCGRRHRRRRSEEEPRLAKSRPVERRPSSVTVVAGELEDSRCGAGGGNNSSWIPAGVVGGKKKGLFGWGGGKKSSGRGECYFLFSPPQAAYAC
jgi:hypothetical protein